MNLAHVGYSLLEKGSLDLSRRFTMLAGEGVGAGVSFPPSPRIHLSHLHFQSIDSCATILPAPTAGGADDIAQLSVRL